MILYLSSPKYATRSLLSPLQLIFLFVFNLQKVLNKSTVQQYCEKGKKIFFLYPRGSSSWSNNQMRQISKRKKQI